MGSASAASVKGPEAIFHNPAALGRFEPESRQEAAFDYGRLLETYYSGTGAYARPLGRSGAIAAGFVYSGQGAQTRYDAQGNAGGTFRSSDYSIGGGYAHRLGKIYLGGGLKVIRQTLDDRSGTGAAVDLGFMAPHASELGDGPVDLGVAINHIGPPIKLGPTADPLPLRLRVGADWHASPVFDAAWDIVLPSDSSPYLCIGFEARLPAEAMGSNKNWSAAARFGYDQSHGRDVDGIGGVTAGVGLDLSGMRLDYAWVPYGDLGTQNRVTLGFRF